MAVCCHRGLCQWIEIRQCRCGKQSSEEAPSLLLSTDNFNIWPRIVFLQLVLWKNTRCFFLQTDSHICSRTNLRVNCGAQVFVAASAWLMSISYHRSAYFCYANSFKMAAASDKLSRSSYVLRWESKVNSKQDAFLHFSVCHSQVWNCRFQ